MKRARRHSLRAAAPAVMLAALILGGCAGDAGPHPAVVFLIGGGCALLVIEGAGHNRYALADFPRDNPLWAFLQGHLGGGR